MSAPGKFVMPFGKYVGMMLEQIPAEYLRWVASTVSHEEHPTLVQNVIECLTERGQMYHPDELQISLHAVERYSIRALDLWRDRREGRGLISCIRAQALQALEHGTRRTKSDSQFTAKHGALIWAFRCVNGVYTVTSVIRSRETSHAHRANKADRTPSADP